MSLTYKTPSKFEVVLFLGVSETEHYNLTSLEKDVFYVNSYVLCYDDVAYVDEGIYITSFKVNHHLSRLRKAVSLCTQI